MDEIVTVTEAVSPYREWIERLVDGTISTADFRERYLAVWARWDRYLRRDVLEVVYPFRAMVLEYPHDESLRDDGDVSPDDLLAGAWNLLAELDREASGAPPKAPLDSKWALPDPATELEEKIRRGLRTGPVALYAFQSFHTPGVQYRPWVERCVLFETVATAILETGTARLTWRSDSKTPPRDADGEDLGLEVWRWPEVGEDAKLADHLALTPVVIEGPPPLTPEQEPMANAWSTLRKLRPKPPRVPVDPAVREERRSMVTKPDITLTLTYDEAFALNELLARWDDDDRVSEPLHKGEQVALWALTCVLEGRIVEAFDDDYDIVLRQVLDRLAEGIESLDHLPD